MTKRERRSHETVHVEEKGRSIRRRLTVLFTVVIAVLIGLIVGFALVLRSPWIDAHRGQIVGLLGLGLLAVLASIPIVVEANVHTRHLSGAGKDPRQGPGPWNLGR